MMFDILNYKTLFIDQTKNDNNMSQDFVLYFLLIFVSITTIISILCWLYNKKSDSVLDNAKWASLLVWGFQVTDFISDINLTYIINHY